MSEDVFTASEKDRVKVELVKSISTNCTREGLWLSGVRVSTRKALAVVIGETGFPEMSIIAALVRAR